MMEQPDERIAKFLRKHHVMTLATASEGGPYCANLFYSYEPAGNFFVFTSDDKTRHYNDMARGGLVAASVVLETRNVGLVQGLQIQGRAERVAEGHAMFPEARNAYLKRFPYAVAADLSLWILRPSFFKLTDNRLGFGKKLIWKSAE